MKRKSTISCKLIVYYFTKKKTTEKKYGTVRTIPKSNQKMIETEEKWIPLPHISMTAPNTHIHDRP